jgi:hypothetical protein
MRAYDAQLVTGATQSRTAVIDGGRDVLERAVALAFLSVFWGVILFMALDAALR